MDAPVISSPVPNSSAYHQTSPQNCVSSANATNAISSTSENPANQLLHHQHLYKQHQISGSNADPYLNANQHNFHIQYNLAQAAPHGLLPHSDVIINQNANNSTNNANNSTNNIILNNLKINNDNCNENNGSVSVISINRQDGTFIGGDQRSMGKIDNFLHHHQHQNQFTGQYYEGVNQNRSIDRYYDNRDPQQNHQKQQRQRNEDSTIEAKNYAGSSGRVSSSSGNSTVDENNFPSKQNVDNFPLSENDLEQISVRDLNKLLQGQEREIISKVKAKRRTLKNRGYALKCRSRRIEIQGQLMTENKALKAEINSLKLQGNWHEARKELFYLRAEVGRLRARLQHFCGEKSVLNVQADQQHTPYFVTPMQGIAGGAVDHPGLVPVNFSAAFNARCLVPVPGSFCLSPTANNSNNKTSNQWTELGQQIEMPSLSSS